MKIEKGLRLVPREYLLPFILLTSLFFAWGLANNMTDTLLAAFKRIMSMSDFETSWIQMAFYGAYFCLALPAAILIKRTSYKTGIVVGLSMFILGALLFYPSSLSMSYGHFLFSLYVLAGGLSILETTANPYIILMGPEATATRRLNLAQTFNPIGSVSGVLLSKYFILSGLAVHGVTERASMSAEELRVIQSGELNAVMLPYVGVAFVLLLILLTIVFTKMPAGSDGCVGLDLLGTLRRLYGNRRYRYGVLTQFFYVGAQISVWSFTIRYAMLELGIDEGGGSDIYIVSLLLFIGARVLFTLLMKWIRPVLLLRYASLGALLCSVIVMVSGGYVGVVSLVLISFFMSLMFPTIYGISITGLGSDTKIGGSGMIMAILGGAVIAGLQGLVSDGSGSIGFSYIVPGICFIAVYLYSMYMSRTVPSAA